MNLKPIHRNIQHQPRIWGVSFFKLFASLFAMLFSIIGFHYLVTRGMAALLFGLGLGVLCLGVSYFIDNRDTIEKSNQNAFIRGLVTSYSLSNQMSGIKEADHGR